MPYLQLDRIHMDLVLNEREKQNFPQNKWVFLLGKKRYRAKKKEVQSWKTHNGIKKNATAPKTWRL